MKTIAFDFEATGTDPRSDRVWQFGIATRESSHVAWVNPQRDYSLVRDKLRISADECRLIDSAPPWADSNEVREFIALLEDADLVVGWNCGPSIDPNGPGYDGPLLASECLRAGWPVPTRPLVDVMMLACQLLDPRPKSWKQPVVAAHLGITFDGHAHRADADSQVTLRIFDKLLPLLPADAADIYDLCRQACDPSWWLRRTQGGYEINCGKYRGAPLREVVSHDPGYIRWVLGLDDIPSPVRGILKEAVSDCK